MIPAKCLMNELFTGKGPRITIIGGGTGLSVILRGLKRITDNLAAVVTMADDGGSSGMLRVLLEALPAEYFLKALDMYSESICA